MINKEILAEIWDDIENKDKKYFKIGFEELDEIIKIEEGKGAIITVGARPAMGKTALSLSFIEKILEQGKKVLAFSLEMSEKQFVQRFLALNAEVDLMRLKIGQLSKSDYEKLAQGLNNLENFDLTISDLAVTTDEIEEKIKEVKPDVVLIDYLQVIEGKRKMDRVTQIDNIMRDLKRIAKEQGVVIFILSQLSRALESRYDKRPLLSDFRESGSIENTSDVVIFIYRPDYYRNSDEDNDIRIKGETEIIVAKNRFGPVDTSYMCFKANIAKFFSGRNRLNDIF